MLLQGVLNIDKSIFYGPSLRSYTTTLKLSHEENEKTKELPAFCSLSQTRIVKIFFAKDGNAFSLYDSGFLNQILLSTAFPVREYCGWVELGGGKGVFAPFSK